MERRVMDALRGHFKPEFLNRIDDIIIFHSLTQEEIKRIVDLQIEILNRRLSEHKLHVSLDNGSRDYLAREGFDPVYGARPLKRAIQRNVQDALAMAILEGRFQEEDEVSIKTDPSGEGLVLEAIHAS
jgi:ATP-dependent Clp protease ATP-binding subunit ClpB